MLNRLLERAEVGLAARTGRRSFLGRLGKGLIVLAAGPFAAVALGPERAEAFHLCGHIFTTGSCPHPFHPLSRVDRHGFPVHPKFGYPVDDQGRLHESREQERRHICHQRVPEKYPYTRPTRLEGTWSRCCNGRIRTIVDCSTNFSKRIQGDAALGGYCFGGRKVFCIVYRETDIRC